jgi:hypothetical protein
MNYAWYAYTRYIIMMAIEEKIWSMTIAEQVSDDQPIRVGICIAVANANVYEQRDETEGCRLRQEDTAKKKFPLQPEDVVVYVITNYIGHRMIKLNYFVYSQR